MGLTAPCAPNVKLDGEKPGGNAARVLAIIDTVMAQTEGLSLLGRVLLDRYFGPRGFLFLGFRGVLRFSISMIFVFF